MFNSFINQMITSIHPFLLLKKYFSNLRSLKLIRTLPFHLGYFKINIFAISQIFKIEINLNPSKGIFRFLKLSIDKAFDYVLFF